MKVLSIYGAAAWSLIFGVLHSLWASGFYILLSADEAEKAFSRPAFFIYNFAVIIICIIGFLLALMQSDIIQTQVRKPVIRFFGLCIAALLTLRGLAGIIHVLYLVVFDNRTLSIMSLWDLWFCLGGFLYYLNTKTRRRQTVMF